VPRPVAHRPAARRRVAEHRHVPGRWHHLVCEALGWHRRGAQRRQRGRAGRVPWSGVQPI